jgi:predicted transcriptional regulator
MKKRSWRKFYPSYLSNNTLAASDLPSVIETVKKAFGGSGELVSTTPSDSDPKT